MPLTRNEITRRHRRRHPEKYTADARRESRKASDMSYRQSEEYREAQRKYRATEKYKQTAKTNHLRHSFGITLEDKQKMYEIQNGICGLCSQSLSFNLSKVHTDHNHRTDKVRKLLCHRCNLLIGFLEKDLSLTGKALQYLMEHA